MSVDDLKAMVVDGFPLSTRRGALWDNLIKILDRLKALNIPCKVWVDGSFLTKKIDPDDVDFVIDLPVTISDNPTPAQKAFLNQLASHAFCKMEKLHSFLMFDAPVMHAEYALSQQLHAQWERDFGFAYVSKEAKGIAVLAVRT
jgi:hypothetical protein